jgi:hypothetical protein
MREAGTRRAKGRVNRIFYSSAARLLASPRGGPVPDAASKGFKRQVRNISKLVRLGQLYRKTFPKKARSQTLWVKFLKQRGPEFLSKKGV